MLRKLNCYVAGHEYTIRCEADRVFLRCGACGQTSSGWSLTESKSKLDEEPKLTRFERLLLGKREPVKANLR